METITSDIIIEIQSGKPYICTVDHIKQGKELRPWMESLGWKFVKEIPKTVRGQKTTVAKYQR